MEIVSHAREGCHELQLRGRLDANWAEHLGNAIQSAIRAGQHHIDLDLALVEYISSAGIGVLVKYYKVLKDAHGVLRVVNPPEYVLTTLKLCRLDELLVQSEESPLRVVSSSEIRRWERHGIVFELHQQTSGGDLEGRLLGHPEKFATGQLSASESRKTRFGYKLIGLGLGAFGSDSADSSKRIGEFLAVGGVAVTQPTDGSSVPDFLVAEGELVPEMHVLYGLTATGDFSHLLRFEAAAGERGAISLAELVQEALEDLQLPAAGFVIVAESASMVGATLRRSPVLSSGRSPWNFPEVRDWLTFTTEPTDERNLALIVGFAKSEPLLESAAFLHRIGPETTAHGHFHAAPFPYRPLSRGNIKLQETITDLFRTGSPQAVLHLLADDREFEGVGQTELMRGACWVGPLQI